MRVLLLSLLLVSGCTESWPQADDFARRLRCGQSVEQTLALASELGAEAGLYVVDNSGRRGVRKGDTEFHLWFVNGRLVAYQRRDYRPITTVISSPRINNCTGVQDVEVSIEVPARYRAGTILVGSQRVAVDNPTTTESVFLSPGTHRVVLMKDGLPTVTKDIAVESRTGTAHVVFEQTD